jgi:hypothetical protein
MSSTTSQEQNTIKVWSWRGCIQKAKVSSNCKLFLYNLSVHMTESGESCFPSIQHQMESTGLSERSIHRAKSEATEAGFIAIRKMRRFVKQSTKSGEETYQPQWCNDYVACYPSIAQLQPESIGTATETAPIEEEEIGTATETAPIEMGTATDEEWVLPHRQPNSSYNNSSNNNTTLRACEKNENFNLFGEWCKRIVAAMGLPVPPNTSRLHAWIASGWDLELDVMPTIAWIKAKYPTKMGIGYCEVAIAEAHAKRLAPVPTVEIEPVTTHLKVENGAVKEVDKKAISGAYLYSLRNKNGGYLTQAERDVLRADELLQQQKAKEILEQFGTAEPSKSQLALPVARPANPELFRPQISQEEQQAICEGFGQLVTELSGGFSANKAPVYQPQQMSEEERQIIIDKSSNLKDSHV